jgi:hypothetical protein
VKGIFQHDPHKKNQEARWIRSTYVWSLRTSWKSVGSVVRFILLLLTNRSK